MLNKEENMFFSYLFSFTACLLSQSRVEVYVVLDPWALVERQHAFDIFENNPHADELLEVPQVSFEVVSRI